MFVGGNLVTWRSKKHNVVALSSAEAEFRGMAKGLCELLWLKRLLTEIGFAPNCEMDLFCDNKAIIDISHNPVQHDRTKHVEVGKTLKSKLFGFPLLSLRTSWQTYLQRLCSKDFYNSLDKLGHLKYILTNLRGSVGVSYHKRRLWDQAFFCTSHNIRISCKSLHLRNTHDTSHEICIS
jgi:hypothetical protein